MTSKTIIFKLIRFSGLPRFFRTFVQRNKITILMFHNPSETSFENAICYLNKAYSIFDLRDYQKELMGGERVNKKKRIILTLDDGHIGNYQLLPLIKKYKIPVTIFLTAGIINTNESFWFNEINDKKIKSNLKKIPNDLRFESIKKIKEQSKPIKKTPQSLNKNQIFEMKEYINFQSHTMSHPILPHCDDDTIWYELSQSRRKLIDEYNLDIDTIAYPNGDYSEETINLAKKAGYKYGVTTDYGFNNKKSDPFLLKRISVNDTENFDELVVKSSGAWACLRTFFGLHSRNFKNRAR